MKTPDVAKAAVSVLVPLACGFVGSLATRPAIPGWYAGLAKPAFAPPNWLFGPAWTLLYVLMGVASFLVWRAGLSVPGVKPALVCYLAQLVLNLAWSWLFFALRSPLAGLVEIAVLWCAIIVTTVLFFRVSAAAGALMLPYIGWVSFAGALNASLWWLNR